MPEDHAPLPDPDWVAHEALAGDLAAALEPDHEPPFCFKADPWLMTEAERKAAQLFLEARRVRQAECARAHAAALEAARAASPEILPSLLILMMRQARRPLAAEFVAQTNQLAWDIRELSRRRYRMQAADAAYALQLAAARPDWAELLVAASAMARRAEPASSPDLLQAVQRAVDSVRQQKYLNSSHRGEIMRNLAPLLPSGPPDGRLDASAVVAGDGWSAVVLAELAMWAGNAASVNLMLHHLPLASALIVSSGWMRRRRVRRR